METAVVKLSGKAVDDFITQKKWIKILNELQSNFDSVLIVHGAGTKITEWSELMNCKSKFINGQRVTDKKTIEIAAAVQAGLINAKIVSFLQSSGFNANGFTGIDRGLFAAESFDKNLGFVGKPVINGNAEWLLKEMKSGVIPVYSSICMDSKGNLMNVNADLFTKAISEAVNATTVLFFSDVSCVKLDGEEQVKLTEPQIKDGISSGEISGGMIPKLNSCIDLLNTGTEKIWIGNDPMDIDLCGFGKKGTWIVNS